MPERYEAARGPASRERPIPRPEAHRRGCRRPSYNAELLQLAEALLEGSITASRGTEVLH